ncbi:FCD domain-containing protein [Amycolatopsis sp. NPDC006131]|uniref:FadR/GntR family transcriptional regulator n=1 Tax=Amycolatopsis sp. NPDC006131 TaxID=3156731 RepID=UPI0033B11982
MTSSAASSGRTPGRRSRSQQVAAELESQILSERLPPGTRLALRTELITRFSASAPVINEALRILRERDLVTVKPGPKGGVFVANPPPQVRLGGIDLWFQGLSVEPEQLFEARRYLDQVFATVALQRATPEDVRAMEWSLDEMRSAEHDPRSWLGATMRLHLNIARASRIEVLVGLYQTIVTTLTATMTKADFVAGLDERRRHNFELHAGIVTAIRERDTLTLEKLMALHENDMVRVA